MSRYMQKNIDGEWEEIVDDPNSCRLLIDDACCNADSEHVADYPDEEDCKRCPFFTPEEEQ